MRPSVSPIIPINRDSFDGYLKSLCLLIVDDDDVDRERIRRTLKKIDADISISEASSGKETLARLQQKKFDCVFIDYYLGDMTGSDLVKKIQSQIPYFVPIIIVTGLGDERLAVQTMQMGIYDYLPKKDITPERLNTMLKSSLQRALLENSLVEAQENLKRMSMFDELTDLPNRYLFFDRLNQAIYNSEREGKDFSLLMMDLNYFKDINDNLGHLAGDAVLKNIGERLQSISRKSDTIARIGGDEFACILTGTDTIEGVIAYADKIIDIINEPLAVEDSVCQLGISIGAAIYPRHGSDAKTLISNADHAMYQAKQSHQKYCIYSEEGHENHIQRIPISNGLPKAIENHELFLEYQPKINLLTKQLIGVEALVRWQSPVFGLISPAQFIPSAERSALIENLTFAIVTMALRQIVIWHQVGWTIPVAINLSARTLDDTSFPAWILTELEKYHLQPSDILFEITETALASSGQRAQSVLTEIAKSGIGISIDDFGSGFTSFKYIRDIDITEIKIDQLFVTGVHENNKDASIIRSIAQLAESLGVRVIAEGVEEKSQWDLLQQLGCNFAQGYSIAFPMKPDRIWRWFQGMEN